MPEVRQVYAQLDPNHVTPGYYMIEGNVLTMVRESGDPVELLGVPVTAKVKPGVSPDSIARVLTKKIRKALRGEMVEGFDQPIDYDSPPAAATGTGFNRALNYPRERF